jgi:hypothetical protein
MANQTLHTHPKPRRVRVPAERARGLDQEFTAQPRPLANDFDLVANEESGLSVAPEDLGAHFLHEAVEDGDFTARDAAEFEFSLREDSAERDEANSGAEISVWTRMVEQAVHDRGASEQLEVAAAFGADALETEREVLPEDEPTGPFRLHDSRIRDTSLMDREGAAFDEIVSPDVEIEDTGRHARVTARDALGEQVSGSAEPVAAHGGGRRRKLHQATGKTLRKAAGKLRTIAKKLKRTASR